MVEASGATGNTVSWKDRAKSSGSQVRNTWGLSSTASDTATEPTIFQMVDNGLVNGRTTSKMVSVATFSPPANLSKAFGRKG
jgi:hypothetical protein